MKTKKYKIIRTGELKNVSVFYIECKRGWNSRLVASTEFAWGEFFTRFSTKNINRIPTKHR